MRWTWGCPAVLPPGETLASRTAKSCGPGAATVASIRSACAGGNGDNKRRSPGRARISRKPLRGESRDVRAALWLNPCALCYRTFAGDCGRSRRPAFPAPLLERGTTKWQNSGHLGARGAAASEKCVRPRGGSRRLLCMGLFSMFLLNGHGSHSVRLPPCPENQSL
jgi:hypothetical protein